MSTTISLESVRNYYLVVTEWQTMEPFLVLMLTTWLRVCWQTWALTMKTLWRLDVRGWQQTPYN